MRNWRCVRVLWSGGYKHHRVRIIRHAVETFPRFCLFSVRIWSFVRVRHIASAFVASVIYFNMQLAMPYALGTHRIRGTFQYDFSAAISFVRGRIGLLTISKA